MPQKRKFFLKEFAFLQRFSEVLDRNDQHSYSIFIGPFHDSVRSVVSVVWERWGEKGGCIS